MHFHICICMGFFFQLVCNDETWMHVESSWYLEEGTIECRNVGFKYFVRILHTVPSSFKSVYKTFCKL